MTDNNGQQARVPVERRAADRFQIEREVQYKTVEGKASDSGGGKTVDISSSGILFTTERQLTPGKRVELAMSWPVRLNQSCKLKLVALGRVIRTELTRAAIVIEKYEFRTLGATKFAGTPENDEHPE